MAVINTQYSTLEEAWGTAGKLKKRVKERECNLYEARTKPKQKPYRNNTSRDLKEHQNMMLMDEDKDNEEYEKYYGYSDARTYSRTNRPINGHKEYFKPKSKKHVSINPEVNKYYYTDDPMDYIQDHNPSSKKVFEEDQEEIEEEIEEEPETPYSYLKTSELRVIGEGIKKMVRRCYSDTATYLKPLPSTQQISSRIVETSEYKFKNY